jgi:antitoxin ParD1/3/4
MGGEHPGEGGFVTMKPDPQADDVDPIWPTPEEDAFNAAQVQALRDQVAAGGLRFESYLAPRQAVWLLDMIEKGVFVDPAHAIGVIVNEARELEPHHDLRSELIKRMITASIGDPRPGLTAEQVFAELNARMAVSRPEPARWAKWQSGVADE